MSVLITGLTAASILALLAATHWFMGRTLFGPSGELGLWEGDIWSSECSQRLADAYSFSHINHGIIFFAILWLIARKLSVSVRYLIALVIEAGWEVLENLPVIIDRYREATIALGYSGDSIVNSLSDVVMMSVGFFLAWRLPWWGSLLLLSAIEIGCVIWVRDNLTLNILMLIHPVDTIKEWQMGGQTL